MTVRSLPPETVLHLAVNAYLAIGDAERLAAAVAALAPDESGPKLSARYEGLRLAAATCLSVPPIEREAAQAALRAAQAESAEALLREAELARLIPGWAKRAKPAA